MNEDMETGDQATVKPQSAIVRFVGGAPRVATVPLKWPVSTGEVTYREIEIHRLTAAEVAAFSARLLAEPDAVHQWPMYNVPDEVILNLDDDDAFELERVTQDFLPLRFRDARKAASTRETGSDTAL